MNNPTIKEKKRARKLALQALYQWEMAQADLPEIEAQFHVANDMSKVDERYFHHVLYGVKSNLQHIESTFSAFLDRPLKQLNPIELSVLRLGTFELLYCLDIPYRVVLDEAITLNKLFGSQDGYRYVNGVLNNVAKQIRYTEINCES